MREYQEIIPEYEEDIESKPPKLKESKIIDTNWILKAEMASDIYTGNLPDQTFDKHRTRVIRERRKIYEIN